MRHEVFENLNRVNFLIYYKRASKESVYLVTEILFKPQYYYYYYNRPPRILTVTISRARHRPYRATQIDSNAYV